MVHLLPQHARDDGEEGLVSFTSGVDYRRTEFHGIYVYERTRPPYNDTLFLQFRYLGEVNNDLLIDHHLVATSPIDPFTYRNTGGHAIVAQVTTEDVGYMYMHGPHGLTVPMKMYSHTMYNGRSEGHRTEVTSDMYTRNCAPIEQSESLLS